MFGRDSFWMDLLSTVALGGMYYAGTRVGYNNANQEQVQRSQQQEIEELRRMVSELKEEKKLIS